MTTSKKDTRKAYKYEPIVLEGNVIHFDGKGDPETKHLKIYKLHGDVRLFEQAIQDFCMDHGYTKCTRV